MTIVWARNFDLLYLKKFLWSFIFSNLYGRKKLKITDPFLSFTIYSPWKGNLAPYSNKYLKAMEQILVTMTSLFWYEIWNKGKRKIILKILGHTRWIHHYKIYSHYFFFHIQEFKTDEVWNTTLIPAVCIWFFSTNQLNIFSYHYFIDIELEICIPQAGKWFITAKK